MDMTNPCVSLYGPNDYANGVTTVADGTAKRLQVEASAPGGATGTQPVYANGPASRLIWSPLLNGTNSNILVNGTAGAPVVFSYPNSSATIPNGATISRLKIVYSLKSVGYTGDTITSSAGLLGIGVTTQRLPNGLLIGGTFGNVSYQFAKITIMEDFLSLNGGVQQIAGDSGRVILADLLLVQTLVGGSSDRFTATVQDQMANISTANTMRIFVGGLQSS